MSVKKFFAAASVAISVSIILSGCSKISEPETAKSGSANQAAALTNNSAANQTPAASNNVGVAANQSPAISNGAAAAGDKKTAPAAAATAKTPPPVVGSGGSDFALFAQARSALNSEKEFVTGVILDIKEGNATLTGSVSSQQQKAKAEQIIKKVSGIKTVKNNLTVSR